MVLTASSCLQRQQAPKMPCGFDAAAKFNGTSLNDQLYQGPDLANSLTGVLICFRQDKVAFIHTLRSYVSSGQGSPQGRQCLEISLVEWQLE